MKRGRVAAPCECSEHSLQLQAQLFVIGTAQVCSQLHRHIAGGLHAQSSENFPDEALAAVTVDGAGRHLPPGYEAQPGLAGAIRLRAYNEITAREPHT